MNEWEVNTCSLKHRLLLLFSMKIGARRQYKAGKKKKDKKMQMQEITVTKSSPAKHWSRRKENTKERQLMLG